MLIDPLFDLLIMSNLTTDPIQVSGQKYALVSFVSQKSIQKFRDQGSLEPFFEKYGVDEDGKQLLQELMEKYVRIGMKLRGCFNTTDECSGHAKELMKMDNSFDVFCVEMYSWVCVPPDRNMIENEVYQEEKLNDLINEHKKEQIRAKTVFEQRKKELMEKGYSSYDATDPNVQIPKPVDGFHPSFVNEENPDGVCPGVEPPTGLEGDAFKPQIEYRTEDAGDVGTSSTHPSETGVPYCADN